ELVAAQPADDVVAAHAAANAPRDAAEQFIAEGVAEGVVDALEAVDVQEQAGEHFTVALGALHAGADFLHEPAAIGRAGKHVVLRQPGQFPFLALAFGDVEGEAFEVQRTAGIGAHHGAAMPDPFLRAVLATDAVFQRERTARARGAADAAQNLHPVVRVNQQCQLLAALIHEMFGADTAEVSDLPADVLHLPLPAHHEAIDHARQARDETFHSAH